jgi:hypothetical protein
VCHVISDIVRIVISDQLKLVYDMCIIKIINMRQLL